MDRCVEVEERRVRQRLPSFVGRIDEDPPFPELAPFDLVLSPDLVEAIVSSTRCEPNGFPIRIVMEDIRHEAADLPQPVRATGLCAEAIVRGECALESPVLAYASRVGVADEVGHIGDPAASHAARGKPAHGSIRRLLFSTWWIE